MIIPDYLIIDEIKRREEKKWQPETHQIPLYIPSTPEPREPERPASQKPGIKKENGAIVINLMSESLHI